MECVPARRVASEGRQSRDKGSEQCCLITKAHERHCGSREGKVLSSVLQGEDALLSGTPRGLGRL